jgi:hypothetical protein
MIPILEASHVTDKALSSVLLNPEDAKPLFFGHYWMAGSIALEAPNAICLDYSAARGGSLIAYRLNSDDHRLSLSNVVV